ncbi:MAG: leucine-rich repeat domain-containing protein [Lachnospiraceae bacterium]|nr:leucine-rich repeat domain-containing protein [Lachnospiraceae bacterium]
MRLTNTTVGPAKAMVPVEVFSSVKAIFGTWAFYKAKIAEINIPDSITTISDSAFGSAEIASFKMPSNVDKVPEFMFENSTLAEIDLTNVKAIDKKAFFYTEIISVTIPDSVTSIGPCAFACSNFQSVEIPENDDSCNGPPHNSNRQIRRQGLCYHYRQG